MIASVAVGSSTENIRRHFLSWESPLLPQAVDWLARDWAGDAPLDLSRVLVVVPTRQAGRRLRAALAALAAARWQAAFPPLVLAPESLVRPAGAAPIASPLEALLAWAEVFNSADLAELRALFPVEPAQRSFSWAWRLAQDFQRLQATLAEAGLRLDDVLARVGADFAERERWENIAQLARRQAELLARVGKHEPQASRIAAAQAPELPPGIERIVVLAVSDPLPLALAALERHARQVPVDVVVAAPEAEAGAFDAWGRPVADAWARREPPFADFERSVHLFPDAAAQAEQIAGLARRVPHADGVLGVAIADPKIAALAENALERAGCAAFNPAGELHRAHGFHQFLSALADFTRDETFAHVVALARTPEVIDWLGAELGRSFGAARWLARLDDLQAKHLPATLAEALAHADGLEGRALDLLAELRAELRAAEFAAGTSAALARVFAARRLDLARPEDRGFEQSAKAWSQVVRECAAAAALFPGFRREDWWEIALQRFGEQAREAEKAPGAIELQGWLELPFEEAPHLVIAGFNDGHVPESIVGDLFLPESLRVRLGLKTNAARFARDAYLLHALVASRRTSGRVDLLLGKVNAQGEPVRPSRLLLACADADLPARIRHLFRPLASGAAMPAWERLWKLRPRLVAPPQRLRVTALRAYLQCPFRFYLAHVLGLDAVEPEKVELDPRDFGTLCHLPLETLKETPWRDCTDEQSLAQHFIEVFDREAVKRFGAAPSVPLVAQLESGRQRLRRAAKVQAEQRAEGWVVVDTEREFRLEIGGITVRGKIDRIDRHEGTGAWRVIDYKTSDAPVSPADAHLGTVHDETPDWARITDESGKPRAWVDLQLPLYVHALPRELPEAKGRVACGYFNLPKAVASTSVALWEDYTPDLHGQAMRCTEALIAAVRAQRYWPPSERVPEDYDAFAQLFHREAKDSIEWPVPADAAGAQKSTERTEEIAP